jgi:hypothetical protein
MAHAIRIGSEEHKELFCRCFTETHDPYDPTKIEWPVLDEGTLARLRALPFWDEAVATERQVALKVQALAPQVEDAGLRDAIALQGYEEGRHAALLQAMTAHYQIPVGRVDDPVLPEDVEWAFIRTGYGECFDSFFAFGLFALAEESGFFPPELVALFDPIVQEEARHVLFFANWIAYRRARQSSHRRPHDLARCALAMALQAWTRLQTARGVGSDEFMMKGHESIAVDLSPGAFLRRCLEENERRLSPYDPRLLRPRFVPALATIACRLLR